MSLFLKELILKTSYNNTNVNMVAAASADKSEWEIRGPSNFIIENNGVKLKAKIFSNRYN